MLDFSRGSIESWVKTVVTNPVKVSTNAKLSFLCVFVANCFFRVNAPVPGTGPEISPLHAQPAAESTGPGVFKKRERGGDGPSPLNLVTATKSGDEAVPAPSVVADN